MLQVHYHHLPPGAEPPNLGQAEPFAAVVIIEDEVDVNWRTKVSRWLVDSGCLYMMAWGHDCVLWDDSVDYANLDDFPNGEIPRDRWVLTTWHTDQPRKEVFWFAQHAAEHPTTELSEIRLLDICTRERREAILAEFKQALDLDGPDIE